MESIIKELEKENNELKLIIQILTKEIEELEAKLNMNSSNSSLAPFSDRFKKKIKSKDLLRKKNEKSSGGQIGHKGSTLQKVQIPDFVVELPNDTCTNCSHDLKHHNLLKRLSRYEDVLRFFTERNAEIFTNNAAEREIRNVKVKSKIQGTFRSDLAPDMFCRIRGYIATMKKQGLNQFDALKRIFELENIISLIAK